MPKFQIGVSDPQHLVSSGKTPELNLAALIVGALVCQDVIVIDAEHTLEAQLAVATRIVAACLKGHVGGDDCFILPFPWSGNE